MGNQKIIKGSKTAIVYSHSNTSGRITTRVTKQSAGKYARLLSIPKPGRWLPMVIAIIVILNHTIEQ